MSEEDYAESAEVAIEAVTERAEEHSQIPRWVELASLSTMVMALFAAIGGLMAGKTGNEALVDREEQISELIELNRLELATEVLLTRIAVIESSGKQPDQSLIDKLERTSEAAARLSSVPAADLSAGQWALKNHEVFAIGTTVLSMAITLTGMAVIVRRKSLWYAALAINAVGALMVLYGVFVMG